MDATNPPYILTEAMSGKKELDLLFLFHFGFFALFSVLLFVLFTLLYIWFFFLLFFGMKRNTNSTGVEEVEVVKHLTYKLTNSHTK